MTINVTDPRELRVGDEILVTLKGRVVNGRFVEGEPVANEDEPAYEGVMITTGEDDYYHEFYLDPYDEHDNVTVTLLKRPDPTADLKPGQVYKVARSGDLYVVRSVGHETRLSPVTTFTAETNYTPSDFLATFHDAELVFDPED